MRVGSLFSGIGGIELGLSAAGMQVVWQCESEPYAREVLRQAWPDIVCYEDVRNLYKKETPQEVDVICGGFPCQPVSCAGARRGRSDKRWLWPEMLRVIREARPKWVVAENVRGLLTSEEGKSFGQVIRSLAKSGYRVGWFLLRAEDVGASHKRERVFILGYSEDHYRRARKLRAKAGARSSTGRRGRSPSAGAELGDTELAGRPRIAGLGSAGARRPGEFAAGGRAELADTERTGEQRPGERRDVGGPAFGHGREGVQRQRGWDAVVNRGGEMADTIRLSEYERRERERVREGSPWGDGAMANTPGDDGRRMQRQGIAGTPDGRSEPGAQQPVEGVRRELANGEGRGLGVVRQPPAEHGLVDGDHAPLANTTDDRRQADPTAAAQKTRRADAQRDTGELPGGSRGPHGELADSRRDRLFWCGAPYHDHRSDASRHIIERCDTGVAGDVHFRDLFPYPPGPGLTVERVRSLRELLREDPETARRVFEAELAETLRWAAILHEAPWLSPSIEPDLCGVVDGVSVPLDRHRRRRLRCLGNSVVPQAAQIIAEAIMQKEREVEACRSESS